MILKTIAQEPKHRWAVAKRIQQISKEELQALYPALHRLEQQGWIKAELRTSETGREAKFYPLSRAGRKHMEEEKTNWDRLSRAINLVVRAT